MEDCKRKFIESCERCNVPYSDVLYLLVEFQVKELNRVLSKTRFDIENILEEYFQLKKLSKFKKFKSFTFEDENGNKTTVDDKSIIEDLNRYLPANSFLSLLGFDPDKPEDVWVDFETPSSNNYTSTYQNDTVLEIYSWLKYGIKIFNLNNYNNIDTDCIEPANNSEPDKFNFIRLILDDFDCKRRMDYNSVKGMVNRDSKKPNPRINPNPRISILSHNNSLKIMRWKSNIWQ